MNKLTATRLKLIPCDAAERTRLEWEILHEIAQPRAVDEEHIDRLMAALAPRGRLTLVKREGKKDG